MKKSYLFFDSASTTRCSKTATDLIQRYALEDFGNPSSSHAMGQQAARAIREARLFFAEAFKVGPDQVIFTGSGSESDNLAIYGVAMDAFVKRKGTAPLRVITSTIEHPAVRRTVESLADFGIDTRFVPIDSTAQIQKDQLLALVTPDTFLVSIHQVNNIVGSILPVEELAQDCKRKNPNLLFHTDAIQAFGKVESPKAPSAVDLVSISGHKICGPKGIGALIILNRKLLSSGLRPILWGGEQEGGFRSGTQNAGLIAAFHAAAAEALGNREQYFAHCQRLRDHLKRHLPEGMVWNSPEAAAPNIVSLSVPGFPSGALAKLLEERGCLVSTGSACSSQKAEPDPVLSAMGLPTQVVGSALRISFSREITLEAVDTLVQALKESIELMSQLLGGKPAKRQPPHPRS